MLVIKGGWLIVKCLMFCVFVGVIKFDQFRYIYWTENPVKKVERIACENSLKKNLKSEKF